MWKREEKYEIEDLLNNPFWYKIPLSDIMDYRFKYKNTDSEMLGLRIFYLYTSKKYDFYYLSPKNNRLLILK